MSGFFSEESDLVSASLEHDSSDTLVHSWSSDVWVVFVRTSIIRAGRRRSHRVPLRLPPSATDINSDTVERPTDRCTSFSSSKLLITTSPVIPESCILEPLIWSHVTTCPHLSALLASRNKNRCGTFSYIWFPPLKRSVNHKCYWSGPAPPHTQHKSRLRPFTCFPKGLFI